MDIELLWSEKCHHMFRVLLSDWNKPCSNNLEQFWFGMVGGLLVAGVIVVVVDFLVVEKFCNNFDKVPVASDIWIVVVGTLVIVVVYVLENGKVFVVVILVFSVIGSCEGWLSDSIFCEIMEL